MQIKKWLLGFGSIALLFSLISVFFIDQPLALWIKEIQFDRYYRIYRTLTDAGEAEVYFYISGLGALFSWLGLKYFKLPNSKHRAWLEKVKQNSLFLLASLLGSGVCLHILKFLFGRQRPHATEDFQAHVFQPFNTHWHYHSMPSGHSQTLLTVATVVWILYPKSAWFVFPMALFLAFTRLAMKAHFLSDVTIGAYVGFAVTLLIARKMKKI